MSAPCRRINVLRNLGGFIFGRDPKDLSPGDHGAICSFGAGYSIVLLLAVYYSQAPGFAGGSLQKAEEYFDQAIQRGPTMLNFRRSLALFLHTKTGDKASFEEDLSWVLNQQPDAEGLPFAWNVFLQKEAKRALENLDRYF